VFERFKKRCLSIGSLILHPEILMDTIMGSQLIIGCLVNRDNQDDIGFFRGLHQFVTISIAGNFAQAIQNLECSNLNTKN
jgi:hypothetical protein